MTVRMRRGRSGQSGPAETYKLGILRKSFRLERDAARLHFQRGVEGTAAMRVGIKASVVGSRRIDSAARTAAEVIREASASGDHQALGRFLRSFTGYLEVSGNAPGSTAPGSPSRPPPRSRDGG